MPYDAGPMQTGRLRVIVDGRTPLLTHNPQSMGVTKGPSKASRIPLPEEEAEAGCYRDGAGALCVRGDAFRGSLLGAAGAWKGKNKSTMKSRLAHVIVSEELIPLKRKDDVAITSYEIYPWGKVLERCRFKWKILDRKAGCRAGRRRQAQRADCQRTPRCRRLRATTCRPATPRPSTSRRAVRATDTPHRRYGRYLEP
jgi:hypothetical protein